MMTIQQSGRANECCLEKIWYNVFLNIFLVLMQLHSTIFVVYLFGFGHQHPDQNFTTAYNAYMF